MCDLRPAHSSRFLASGLMLIMIIGQLQYWGEMAGYRSADKASGQERGRGASAAPHAGNEAKLRETDTTMLINNFIFLPESIQHLQQLEDQWL